MSLTQELIKAYKYKGFVLRDLAKEIGVSLKTVQRYINLEVKVPEDKARLLAHKLFNEPTKRRWCIVQFAEVLNESKGGELGRKERKRLFTYASKFISATTYVSEGVRISKESEKYFQKSAKDGSSPFETGKIEFIGGDRDAGVVISDLRIKKPNWQQIGYIKPEELSLNIEIGEGRVLPRSIDFKKNANDYFDFCKKNGLGPFALFDIAKLAVESSKRLDENSYESKRNILIEKNRLVVMKSSIGQIRESIEKGRGKKKKGKVISDLRYLEAELDLHLQSVVAIKSAREALLKFIDSQIEMIRNHSPSK